MIQGDLTNPVLTHELLPIGTRLRRECNLASFRYRPERSISSLRRLYSLWPLERPTTIILVIATGYGRPADGSEGCTTGKPYESEEESRKEEEEDVCARGPEHCCYMRERRPAPLYGMDRKEKGEEVEGRKKRVVDARGAWKVDVDLDGKR